MIFQDFQIFIKRDEKILCEWMCHTPYTDSLDLCKQQTVYSTCTYKQRYIN